MIIRVNQSQFDRCLFLIIGVVAVAGLAVELLQELLRLEENHEIVAFFSLSFEQNVPTWLAVSLHALVSLLLLLIATGPVQRTGKLVKHWWGLSVVFACISMDELIGLHEEMSGWFNLGGIFYFGWVLPASAFVLTFALLYLRFLGHLSQVTRFRFARAGAIFVLGALGVELFLGYWTELHGDSNLGYALIDWVEETLELVGTGLFLSAVLAVLGDPAKHLRLVAPGRTAEGIDSNLGMVN